MRGETGERENRSEGNRRAGTGAGKEQKQKKERKERGRMGVLKHWLA